MATTVPMLAPDGSSGDIPQARVTDALNSGFKLAVPMTSPDGKNGYVPSDKLQQAKDAGFKPSETQQPGFWENLGKSVGLDPAAAEQERQDLMSHPASTIGKIALDAALGPVKPLVDVLKSSIPAGYRMGQELAAGNPAAAGVNAIQAVPIVGPALNTMVAQSPPNRPGTPYMQQVANDATGGNVGTALGTAAQVAPFVLGGVDQAAPNRVPLLPLPKSIPAKVPGQNYTQDHAAAFEGAISPATGMGKNFEPQRITPQALTPIRDTASRMVQGSPLEQILVRAATDPSTPPLTRIKAYQGVVQSALNDLEAQHAQGLASAQDVAVNTKPLVQQLQAEITKTTDPADVSAIRNLIMRTKQVQNIGDLDTFRKQLNNETSAEFKQSQIQAGRSGTSVQAASDLADSVRSAYYDNLGQATAVDYSPLKLQESNLLSTKEALQNQQSGLAKSEATFNAPSTLREKLGSVANIVKDPKTTITQTILRESPATRISTLLQKSLADLAPAPSSSPMLSAGAREGQPPPGPQGVPTRPPNWYPTSTADRLGRLLKAPPIELPGAVEQPVPAYAVDSAASRTGRLLPERSSAPTITPYDPGMTPGERSAALMQYLRQKRQLALPSKVPPIQLSPPPPPKTSLIQQLDPNDLVFRESPRRLEQVRENFPEGSDYTPIVTMFDGGEHTIIDGHHRAALAIERSESIPAASVTKAEYKAMKSKGYDDMEISHAALVNAKEIDAADNIEQQFGPSGGYRDADEDLEEIRHPPK